MTGTKIDEVEGVSVMLPGLSQDVDKDPSIQREEN